MHCLISWKLPTPERSSFDFPSGPYKPQRELKARNILMYSPLSFSLYDSDVIHRLRANACGRGEKSSLRVCSSNILIRAQRRESGTFPQATFFKDTPLQGFSGSSVPPFQWAGKLTKVCKNNQTHRNAFVYRVMAIVSL